MVANSFSSNVAALFLPTIEKVNSILKESMGTMQNELQKPITKKSTEDTKLEVSIRKK